MSTKQDDIFLPEVNPKLIDGLERQFPSKPPRRRETLEDLMVRAGHAEIIEFLREQWRRQNDIEQE